MTNAPSSLTPAQQASYESELGASAAAPNPTSTFETTAPYQNVETGIQNAVEQANLWNSGNNVAALSTALQPFEGSNATAGDTTLDSLLLSQTPGAYQSIENAVAPAAALPGQLTTGATAADTALQNAVAQDTASTGAAQSAANSYLTNLQNYLTSTVASDQAAENAATLSPSDQQALVELLGPGSNLFGITPAQESALGISPTDEQTLSSAINLADQPQAWYTPSGQQVETSVINPIMNLDQYLTQNSATTPNAANVASTQNYSDVAALLGMLGGYSPSAPNPLAGANPDQAGTFQVTPSDTFNYTAALGDLDNFIASQQQPLINAGDTQTPPPSTYTPPPAPVIINGPSAPTQTPPTMVVNPPTTPGGPTTITITNGDGTTTTVPIDESGPPGDTITTGPDAPGGGGFAGLAYGGKVKNLKSYLGVPA